MPKTKYVKIKNRDTKVVSTVSDEAWKTLQKSNKQRVLEETKDQITRTVKKD